MSEPITISLQGPPQGKGRARAFVRGGHVGHYTPEKTRTYEGMIRTAAMQELAGGRRSTPPVEIFIARRSFPVPASWSERKRQQAHRWARSSRAKSRTSTTSRRRGTDALNGVVYRDDA